MEENGWLADRFEEHRTRLWAVAYRMLGSIAESDDAVQDAWVRLSRADRERDLRTSVGGWQRSPPNLSDMSPAVLRRFVGQRTGSQLGTVGRLSSTASSGRRNAQSRHDVGLCETLSRTPPADSAIGIFETMFGISMALGPALGGSLVSVISWRPYSS